MMSRISQKLGGFDLAAMQQPGAAGAAAGAAGAGSPAATPAAAAAAPPKLTGLHEACKLGDVKAIEGHLNDGADMNGKNERGVTPLGVAVGYNKVAAVKCLLKHGADVMARDAKGNTVLHYAAGYGRKEVAEVLIAAGAEIDALNGANQQPVDVAKVNRERAMVAFLQQQQNTRQED